MTRKLQAIAGRPNEAPVLIAASFRAQSASLVLEFRDGLKKSLRWYKLALSHREPALRPETARPSEHLDAVVVTDVRGRDIDVDASVLHSLCMRQD